MAIRRPVSRHSYQSLVLHTSLIDCRSLPAASICTLKVTLSPSLTTDRALSITLAVS